MKVRLPDSTELDLPDRATGGDAAAAIGPGLAKAALAVKADGKLLDLSAELHDGAALEIVTDKSPEALELIRHDAAHVLAEAVLDLYPGTKVSIGRRSRTGFYYDFEFPEDVKVTDADLEKIEAQMREHIKADEPFERDDIGAAEAEQRFSGEQQDYKVELIRDLVSR